MTVAIHEPDTHGLESKMKYAQALAVSNLLPRQYQQSPANVLLAMELGEALGVPPIQAINGIHVVEGKPSASADLIASLVRRAGHKLRTTVDDDALVAVAQIIRQDDPDFVFEARWDMEKARKAGLAGKGVWKNYPGQMLRNRAITEVARMGASDALYGVIYTPEELGAEVTPDGGVIVQQVQETPQAPAPALSMAEAVQAHQQVQEPQAGPTGEQLSTIARLIGQLDLGREEYLEFVAGQIGQAKGTKELTPAEADLVIAALSADPAPNEVVAEDAEVHEAELVPDTADDGWPQVATPGGAA